jgi:LAGLIDADG endonuclease
VVIEHFDKYPLITQKLADYILFKQAYNIILNKEHLTFKGLNQLVSIKGSQNKGLSPILQFAFSDSINTKRPLVSKNAQNMPNPH